MESAKQGEVNHPEDDNKGQADPAEPGGGASAQQRKVNHPEDNNKGQADPAEPGGGASAQQNATASGGGFAFNAGNIRDFNYYYSADIGGPEKIQTFPFVIKPSDAALARDLQRDLNAMCRELQEKCILFIESFDESAVHAVACAIAADQTFDGLCKRIAVAEPQSESSRGSAERRDKTAKNDEEPEHGQRKDERLEKFRSTITQDQPLTFHRLCQVAQPDLCCCLLVVSVEDVLMPTEALSETYRSTVLGSLNDHNRFLLFKISGENREQLGEHIRKIRFQPRLVDAYPYLIARLCPKIKETEDRRTAATQVREILEVTPLTGIVSSWEKFRYLRETIASCADADNETFANAFRTQLKNWQSQLADAANLMSDLGYTPEDHIVRVLRFVVCYLPRLEPMEFHDVVRLLLEEYDKEEKADVARQPDEIELPDGRTKLGKPPADYVERWRLQRATLLHNAKLVVRGNDGQKRSVVFQKIEDEHACRKYFEDTHFDRVDYFRKMRRSDALFKCSRSASTLIADFYAAMAIAEPTEFRKNCARELIHYCLFESREPLEQVTARFADIIKSLAERNDGRELVDYVRDEIVDQHESPDLALALIDRLSLHPAFDSLSWFQVLVETSTSDERFESAIGSRLLNLIERHPDGQYFTTAAIAGWLRSTAIDGSPSTQALFAERFFATVALSAWPLWLKRRFESTSTVFHLFLALDDPRAEGTRLLDDVVCALLGDAARAWFDKEVDGVSQSVGSLAYLPRGVLALVLAAWICLLRDEETARAPRFDTVRLRHRFIDALASQLSGDDRSTLINAWERYNDVSSEQLGDPTLSRKHREITRDFARNVLLLRRELMARPRRRHDKRVGQDARNTDSIRADESEHCTGSGRNSP